MITVCFLQFLFIGLILFRVSAMLRHVQDNCPKTSISYMSCLNYVTNKMSYKFKKFRPLKAVPSKSPIAVRYGMAKLSGSLPEFQNKCTIQLAK
jgi:hypothetical protein